MKRILIVVALLLTIFSAKAQTEQQMPQLPTDPAFRIGKLENGLTYYIRHNDFPKNTANFYIVDRVGSVQENDQQQGLAHFLEHMAFYGSERFPEGNMMEIIQRLGVTRFNAETAFDWTRYYLCDVSTAHQSTLDSCMLILRDWANGLLLNEDQMKDKRGAIHQEWQGHQGPDGRFMDKHLADMLPGSKYGLRNVIGKMEIVDNVNPKQLRDYYHTWYRPDNQAIVVIGNIDVDAVENQIKKLFSDIKMPKDAPKVEDYPVPDNDKAICIYYADKDQESPTMSFFLKHDNLPTELMPTAAKPINDFLSATMTMMLNQRLDEIARQPDAPFTAPQFYDTYLMGIIKTKQGLASDFQPKQGKEMEAMKRVAEELLRIGKFGFTATEFGRAKNEYMSQMEKFYNNRNSTPNDYYFNQAFENFNHHEPIVNIETEYQLMKMVTQQLPVDVVNQYAKEIIANCDSNLITVLMIKDQGQDVKQGEDQMRQALAEARQAKLTAYVDNVKQEPLMTTLPKKGSVVSTKENKQLGYKEYTLSNGAKVLFKKTDFKADEVAMTAESEGGASLYGKADYVNCNLLNDISETYTVNGHNSVELNKMLAGKQVSIKHEISSDYYTISGTTTPKDLETQLQLYYLSFTSTGKDQQAYDQQMTQKMQDAKVDKMDPEEAFKDSLNAAVYLHNPYNMSLDSAALTHASYDRILSITRDATANAANWVFYISGNVDEAVLLPLIEQYIASLPGKPGQKPQVRDLRTLAKGELKNVVSRKMVTPRAFAAEAWITESVPASLDCVVYPIYLSIMMSNNTMKSIREKAGIAYTPQNYIEMPRCLVQRNMVLYSYSEVKPGTTEQATTLMKKALNDLATTVTDKEVNDVKRMINGSIDVMMSSNDFWLNILASYNAYGIDLGTNFKSAVNGVTAESIKKFVSDKFLNSGRHCEVIMNAAEK